MPQIMALQAHVRTLAAKVEEYEVGGRCLGAHTGGTLTAVAILIAAADRQAEAAMRHPTGTVPRSRPVVQCRPQVAPRVGGNVERVDCWGVVPPQVTRPMPVVGAMHSR